VVGFVLGWCAGAGPGGVGTDRGWITAFGVAGCQRRAWGGPLRGVWSFSARPGGTRCSWPLVPNYFVRGGSGGLSRRDPFCPTGV